jgi:intracellular septation protein
MKSQKRFFLISFLPALAYWYLEENYSLQIALTGGLVLAVIEISLEWLITRHIHTISKFNFFLIAILGGISLLASEGVWFKLQPFFTGVLMGGYLLYRYLRDESMLFEMTKDMGQNAPKVLVEFLERNLAVFLIAYGFFMGAIALFASTDKWVFYKTVGFYIVSMVFFVSQLIYIRIRLKKDSQWLLRK